MKKLLIGLLTISSLTVFAEDSCLVAFDFDTSGGAYSDSILKKRNARKIKKIMQKKGYTFLEKADGSEDYELSVDATQHYMCGYSASVATFRESITLDMSYSVKLKLANGNDVFKKEGQVSRIFLNFPSARTRYGLMKAVRQIPECGKNN